MTEADITAQAIARICHDLISPIGAIGNGVELLGDICGRSPELDLIAESAASARHKIAFFRVAFESARPNTQLTGASVTQIATEMFLSTRMRVEVLGIPKHLSHDEARLLFLLMLCAESALPLGGKLTIQPQQDGWQLTGNGRRIALESPYWAHLETGAVLAEWPAARVHFALARRALQARSNTLSHEISDTSLTLHLA